MYKISIILNGCIECQVRIFFLNHYGVNGMLTIVNLAGLHIRIEQMDHSSNWETIIETLQDGVLIVDVQGNISAVNAAAEHLTGYSAEEMVGNSCRILNCTGCKNKHRDDGKWCGLFAKKKVKSKRCTITSKGSKQVYVLKNASLIHDKDGNVVGAVEILTDISESIQQEKKILTLRKNLNLDEGYHDLIGKSQVMQQMFELIESVAQSDAPVMIQGDSGTGKELAAMAIHETSPRRDKSFIKVNCAALNENLLESELFGHVKGAFTGADRTRIGRFEAADGGSLFLDEIGDIPQATQVKLLRVLESGVIERVGDHRPIPIDVRIITATNKNLEYLISKSQFREDLFFRIHVFPIYCPALKERPGDIPILIQNFIKHGARKGKKNIHGVTPAVMEKLIAYPWPGNVRELRNTIEYATVLCHDGLIGVEHLPPKVGTYLGNTDTSVTDSPVFQAEKEKLIQALKQTGGNQTEAGKILGVSRVTIWKRMKKYNISV
jgi:two-component system response regulator HydG